MDEKRWYDRYKQTTEALELLKQLDNRSREIILNDIVTVASSIKVTRKEEEELPLSIGLERVLGLYQTHNSRRWYDKSPDIKNAIMMISTLPEEDFINIMEGICISLQS